MENVYLLVLDGMADWEPGYATAGINQPAFQSAPGRYAVTAVGLSLDPITTMGGLRILPELTLDQVTAPGTAMLILPGGLAWEAGASGGAVEKARELLEAGVPVAAICAATWALAGAGLLNDRPHTSNAADYLSTAPGYTGSAHYVDAPAVLDGDLITAGGTAPVDFARCIFERLELYPAPVLDAWYRLYAHRDASGFHALMAADAEPV